METEEVFEMAAGAAAIYSTKAPEKTTPNEDAAALLPLNREAALLVVADGLGGESAGEQASSLAVKMLREATRRSARDGELFRTAILDAIETANTRIQDLGVGAGTTLAVVEVQGATIRPYHAGDSMILVAGQRGKIKLQTVSHSPVGYALEAGVLDEDEAIHHEERHIVSNVLGSPEMRIELGAPMDLAARDTLVLASDGLFDNLHVDEIVEIVRKGSLGDAVRVLAATADGRMRSPKEGEPSKSDDLTILAFRRGARTKRP